MNRIKTLETRNGFLNRHLLKLPLNPCRIVILSQNRNGEQTHKCEWKPFNKENYNEDNMPHEGYLGTATVIEGDSLGIGFHVWEQNDSEFIHYSIID